MMTQTKGFHFVRRPVGIVSQCERRGVTIVCGANRRSGDEDVETGERWVLKGEFSDLLPAQAVKAADARQVRRFSLCCIAMLNVLCKRLSLFASVSPRRQW